MSVQRLVKLGLAHAPAARRFCEENPHRCTYIAGWIEDGGLRDGGDGVSRAWLLGELGPEDRIEGLVYISDTGIVIPAVRSEAAIEDVVRIGRRNPNAIRVLVGERKPVASLWTQLESIGMLARISRDQLGYSVDRAAFKDSAPSLTLVRAAKEHLDQIVELSGAMALEEARDDPHGRNPDLFRARIEERLVRGRDFIYIENGVVVFKSNISAVSPTGGQVEGIYTLPAHRGRGLGFAGTAAVTRWVLERSEHAFLLVNDDNETAKRIYEKLGYRQVLESRTIFVA
jgi:uncharacterized protein